MSTRDQDFDPDDNFAPGPAGHGLDDGDSETEHEGDLEVLAWQWLLRINPGDDEAAMQQFQAYRELLGEDDDAEAVLDALERVTDWRASFRIAETERTTLIDAIETLAERFRVDIDWGVEDPTDAAALAHASTGALIEAAYDQLRVAGYTLWTWDTGDETVAGVLAPRDEDEAMRVLGNALGLELRPGAG